MWVQDSMMTKLIVPVKSASLISTKYLTGLKLIGFMLKLGKKIKANGNTSSDCGLRPLRAVGSPEARAG